MPKIGIAADTVTDPEYDDYVLGIRNSPSGQLVKWGRTQYGEYNLAAFSGVDRTGGIDSYAGWLDCLAAAKSYANTYGSAVIYLPPGAYRTSLPWVIDQSAISLRGTGLSGFSPTWGSVIFPTENFPNDTHVVQVYNAAGPLDGNVLERIRVAVHPDDTLQNTVHGVLYAVQHGVMEYVSVNQLSGDGVVFDGVLGDTHETRINGVWVRQCGGDGIRTQNGCSDWHFHFLIIRGNGGYSLHTPGANNIYTNCHFYNGLSNLFLGNGGSGTRFSDCKFEGSKNHNIYLLADGGSGSLMQFDNCRVRNYAMLAAGTYDLFHVSKTTGNNTVSGLLRGCTFLLNAGHNAQRNDLHFADESASNWNVRGNFCSTASTGGPIYVGAGARVFARGNTNAPDVGFLGSAVIPSGLTSVVVEHDFDVNPGLGAVRVMPVNNPTNDPGNIWVSGVDETQFVVNCRNDPGASGLNIEWKLF